jgi:hypothetical protein
MFTVDDLHAEMAGMNRNCLIKAGQYDLSIGFSSFHYCRPRRDVEPCEYTAVEIALFKDGEWVTPDKMESIEGFKWANMFERGFSTAVAACVPVQTVCDILNFLRES